MLLFVFIILIGLLLLINTRQIPKHIWTFWDSEVLPPFIKKCINTWRIHNPDYKITILNKNNIESYLGRYESNKIINWKYNDSPQRFSDLVRLSILEKYGGIWMDASVVCQKPLNWIHGSCVMYSIPELSKDPVLESWFIACTRNNRFIKELNSEFRSVNSIDEYVSKVSTNGIDHPNYLLIYVCARKVFHKYPYDVTILDATKGPYNYHTYGGVSSLLTHDQSHQNLLKFRHDDRDKLTPEIESVIFQHHLL
jgi:hypothetical protein